MEGSYTYGGEKEERFVLVESIKELIEGILREAGVDGATAKDVADKLKGEGFEIEEEKVKEILLKMVEEGEVIKVEKKTSGTF